MDRTQKLYSDMEKIKKMSLQKNGGKYKSEEICNEIKDLFIRTNRDVESLASSIASWWYDNYITGSEGEQPSQENKDRLLAAQSLLDNNEEGLSILTKDDFKQLCAIVNMEAEDLPMDMLNDLMSIFVSKQAY